MKIAAFMAAFVFLNPKNRAFGFKGSIKEVNQMWNIPNKERLTKLSGLYQTENTPLKDKLIYLHFFIAGCDWYIVEYDGKDLFFGFAILNNDLEMAEWGYVSFKELIELKIDGWLEVDCEREDFWKVKRACEVEKIRKAMGWGSVNRRTQKGKKGDKNCLYTGTESLSQSGFKTNRMGT